MSSPLLLNNDQVFFNPTHGAALITTPTITFVNKVSKNTAFGNRPITVLGDEKTWAIVGCTYTNQIFVSTVAAAGGTMSCTPGVGTLTIVALSPSHISKKVLENNIPVLLVAPGTNFTSQFTVNVPAQLINNITGATSPDPAPIYAGQGNFIQAIPAQAIAQG